METTLTPSAERPRGGSGAMFDRIARRYDFLNRVLSMGLDRTWRRRAVAALNLDPGDRLLDLATGTADIALEALHQQPAARVVGLDPSQEMLAIGRRKVARRGLTEAVELRAGSAEILSFETASFDGVAIAFGIRNVPDRLAALREMARVLRPDGRLAVLELSEPRRGLAARLARWHIHVVVPWLGALLSGAREYRYLERSIAAFPSPGRFGDLMRQAGLEVLEVRPMMLGSVCLFVARPRGEGS